MLTFASGRIEAEWESGKVHPLVRRMVMEASAAAYVRHAWIFHITCIFRTREEDAKLDGTGIHTVWRAVDVRDKDVDPAWVVDVTEATNRVWTYDPKRPALVCAYAKPHGSGPHIHFQAHGSTTRKS